MRSEGGWGSGRKGELQLLLAYLWTSMKCKVTDLHCFFFLLSELWFHCSILLVWEREYPQYCHKMRADLWILVIQQSKHNVVILKSGTTKQTNKYQHSFAKRVVLQNSLWGFSCILQYSGWLFSKMIWTLYCFSSTFWLQMKNATQLNSLRARSSKASYRRNLMNWLVCDAHSRRTCSPHCGLSFTLGKQIFFVPVPIADIKNPEAQRHTN